MIKNIIFDIGGVIFDDSNKNVKSANSIGLKSIEYKYPQDIIDSLNNQL